MNKNYSSLIIGACLIGIGLLFLANNLFYIDGELLWPLIFLALALIMGGSYLSNREKNCGTLVPFGIFVVLWAVFQFCAVFGWEHMDLLWPSFIFAPGFGLFLLYLHKQDKGLLIPVTVLVGMSFIFFIAQSEWARYWPLMLIAGGVILVLHSLRGRRESY